VRSDRDQSSTHRPQTDLCDRTSSARPVPSGAPARALARDREDERSSVRLRITQTRPTSHKTQGMHRSAAPLPSPSVHSFAHLLQGARRGTIVKERRQLVVRRSLQELSTAPWTVTRLCRVHTKIGSICENEKRERRERAMVLSNRRRSARTPSDRSR
jgi:hypothetical protein